MANGKISQELTHPAVKELGLGLPPDECRKCGMDPDEVMAAACDPKGRHTYIESVDWSIPLPLKDADIGATFNETINIFGTKDGGAPPGVADASNSMATPGIFPGHILLKGFRFRFECGPLMVAVEGAALDPHAAASMPGVPDVWTEQDRLAALGLTAAQIADVGAFLPAIVLVNLPGFLAMDALLKGYNVKWKLSDEEIFMDRRLSSCNASIRYFSEAQAAGTAFMSNQVLIREFNDRMTTLAASNQQFLKRTHERVGVLANAGTPVGAFTVSSESDASSVILGGPGVPDGPMMGSSEPYVFARPMLWLAGRPMGLEYKARSQFFKNKFQRWLSVTGGVGGVAGSDLNLAQSAIAGLSGLAPTTPAANIMLEQALDIATSFFSEQRQTNAFLGKSGDLRMAIDVVGTRVTEPWYPYVRKRIDAGLINAPFGYAELR